jgi:Protein of unknown function (DUF2934)
MPNTPKATDGETLKKRTRKTASAPEDSNKVVTAVKKVAAKSSKTKDVAAVTATQDAKPEVKSEVFVMQSLEEKVRARAYELYLRRGGMGGSPEQDWFQAMQEVYGESVA